MARPASPSALQRAGRLLGALKERYPDAHCELDAGAPHELLIATILSAQATDVGVNKATPGLFAAFRTPADYAASSPEAIGEFVRTVNFWRNKATSIHASMTAIQERFGGRVPETMDELLTLRGVARKTANVVLGECFGKAEGIVVDTHVARLANRFRLSAASDPVRIERDLMRLFPPAEWTILSHLLIFHGRRACKARGGLCAEDPICREFGRCAKEAARLSARRGLARKPRKPKKPKKPKRAQRRSAPSR